MSPEYRFRMRFAVAHGFVAVPVWAWLYVIKDVPVYGVFVIIHAVLTGLALGILFGGRIVERADR
jgi:hypothetical protein